MLFLYSFFFITTVVCTYLNYPHNITIVINNKRHRLSQKHYQVFPVNVQAKPVLTFNSQEIVHVQRSLQITEIECDIFTYVVFVDCVSFVFLFSFLLSGWTFPKQIKMEKFILSIVKAIQNEAIENQVLSPSFTALFCQVIFKTFIHLFYFIVFFLSLRARCNLGIMHNFPIMLVYMLKLQHSPKYQFSLTQKVSYTDKARIQLRFNR